MNVYSRCVLGYSDSQCTGGTVIFILAVYWGTVTVYSRCVLVVQ